MTNTQENKIMSNKENKIMGNDDVFADVPPTPAGRMAEALGLTIDEVMAMTWADLERHQRRMEAELRAAESDLTDIDHEIGRRMS